MQLLGDPLSSYIGLQFLLFEKKNNIKCLALSQNSAHFLQPLIVTLMSQSQNKHRDYYVYRQQS